MPREKTTALIEAVEEGVLTWESIARAALNYMSESDVAEMARLEELLDDDDDEDDEDDDEIVPPLFSPSDPEFAPNAHRFPVIRPDIFGGAR